MDAKLKDEGHAFFESTLVMFHSSNVLSFVTCAHELQSAHIGLSARRSLHISKAIQPASASAELSSTIGLENPPLPCQCRFLLERAHEKKCMLDKLKGTDGLGFHQGMACSFFM